MPAQTTAPQNGDSLNKIANHIGETATMLRAQVEVMGSAGFEELIVSNHDQLIRGLKFLDNYCNALRKAIRTAREERGDFQAEKSNGKKKVAK